tara:strand:+ start:2306 stop:3571 length:1266 start_codon:yes stop_codon:yes gene_type:complete
MSNFSYIDTNGAIVSAPKSILNKIETENEPIISNNKDKIIMENAVPQTLATQKRDQKIATTATKKKQRIRINLKSKADENEKKVQLEKIKEQRLRAQKQNKQAQTQQTQEPQTQQLKKVEDFDVSNDNVLNILQKKKTNSELMEFFKANPNITDKTKLTYHYDYERLKTLLNTKGHISNLSQSKILTAIKKSDKATRPLINIAIVLFKFKNKPHKMLINYREEIFTQQDGQQKTKNQQLIKDANMSYDELIATLNKSNGDDYLLFYLLINYNLRNMDLIIRLVTSASQLEDKDKINYIVYQKDKSTLVINNYKTSDTYGAKSFVIKDKKFLDILAYKTMNKDKYLFNNRKAKPYRANEMSNHIKTRFKHYLPQSKVTQAIIFKIIHNKNESNNDYSALKKMSKNRGQLIDTADKQYSSIDV